MIRKITDFIAFRTTRRYNVLKLRELEPNYWDKDTIMLYAVMQLVVDFVEIECAFMELDAPYTWRQWINFRLPWFLRNEEVYRNRELGLRHLDMLERFYDEKVKGPSQAPKEIKEVYLWWKDVRPNRISPDVASGFSEYMKSKGGWKLEDINKRDAKLDKIVKKSLKIEEQYHKEDTEMLIKIIKLRDFMWT